MDGDGLIMARCDGGVGSLGVPRTLFAEKGEVVCIVLGCREMQAENEDGVWVGLACVGLTGYEGVGSRVSWLFVTRYRTVS